ncbi:MAG TPA: biliverdin-producing heme oxygenase [Dietzia timorensis]|uniref:Biliverdin-producing heme oxygenase n=1 Tax=Dietzia timorensis TaxID=499555 RepID=A0A921F604_9ACTN|nr:biliverdin-producing heme oxygenase [Dietzia timorensis]HJE91528.1 biliverdin-producing heme oxygenase [Dietzia timorensis]
MTATEISHATAFSTELKSATAKVHEEAEHSIFMDTLLRGDLDASTGTAALAALHAQYLHVYDALEDAIGAHANSEFLAPLHDARLERTASLRADLDALSAAGVEFEREPHAPTQAYVAELRELGASDSREAAASLAGHHYVRYLGDLSGGQVVSRLVSRAYSIPAESLSFYSFDIEKPKVFKDSYRAALDQLPLDEATRALALAGASNAFAHNTALFRALEPVVAES